MDESYIVTHKMYSQIDHTKVAQCIKMIDHHLKKVKYYERKMKKELDTAIHKSDTRLMTSLCFNKGCEKRVLTNGKEE